MLRLPAFRYEQPGSLEEAADILAKEGPRAAIIAGGTDLLPKMKRRQMEPKTLVATRQLNELRVFRGSARDGLVIGANWTLAELQKKEVLAKQYPAVVAAARAISSPPLQSMGTLGGNLCVDTRCNYYDQTYEWRKSIQFCLKKDGDICWVAPGSRHCWAVSSSDLAPVMLALDAQIGLFSRRGRRRVAARDFYKNDGIDYLGKMPDEILTEIHIPPASGLTTFQKLRRRGSIDFPILNVAIWLLQEPENGTCKDIRIAIGGVAPAPFLVESVRPLVAGRALTEEMIEAIAGACQKEARPLDNTDLNFSWRRRMVSVWVRRALEELLGQAAAGSAPDFSVS